MKLQTIDAEKVVKRIAIEVAARQDGIAVIAKGLAGGEMVVIDGQYRLENGTKVAVRNGTGLAGGSGRAAE